MNFYDCLGVEKTATALEIKKAYFRLVRKFTPEKAPEKFMQLRQAYETLSDDEKRDSYTAHMEKYSDSPKEITAIIMEADGLCLKGLFSDAVNLLENSEFFLHNEIQAAMCRVYMTMGKSGQAVTLAERLIADNPDNADYHRLAVMAYANRGWKKKADEAQSVLERLDPFNEENSMPLLLGETEQVSPFSLGAIVEAIESAGKKAPILCACILENFFWHKQNDAELVPLTLGDNPGDWADPMFVAQKLEEHTRNISGEKRKEIHAIVKDEILSGMFSEDMYNIFPHIEQTIKNIHAEDLFEYGGYKIAEAAFYAIEAVRLGTPRELVTLSLMYVWLEIGFVDSHIIDEYQDEVLVSEIEILTKSHLFIPHIRKFQRVPFYQHAADFFEMVLKLNDNKLANELRRRATKARDLSSRLTLAWLGGTETDLEFAPRSEPIRVTKIGRNEPCPCGSGKKYKKCCG